MEEKFYSISVVYFLLCFLLFYLNISFARIETVPKVSEFVVPFVDHRAAMMRKPIIRPTKATKHRVRIVDAPSNNVAEKNKCSADAKEGEEGQFNPIMVMSVKGSGNTWTRQLLQAITGVYAGSMYGEIGEEMNTEEKFREADWPGGHFDPLSGRLIGIKTHAKHHLELASSIIFIIRNPYDTFKSEFNRKRGHVLPGENAHTKVVDPRMFAGDAWRRNVAKFSSQWNGFYETLIKEAKEAEKNYYLLFYENLKIDLVGEARKIYDFLQKDALKSGEVFTVENIEDRLKCIGEEDFSKFKRKHQELSFELYTDDEKLKINQKINNITEFFRENNIDYPKDIVSRWLQ